MQAMLCLVALSLGLLAPGVARSVTPSTVEAQVLALEEAWNNAHLEGDVEVLDQLWAEDLVVIVPEMPIFTKPELLGMWQSVKVQFTAYETADLAAHVHGDSAIVIGRLHRSRNFGGQARTEDWRFTKSYARIDGRWQVVAYHASALPAP